LGVKERHEREREAVGRAILDAARELFVAEGYSNVSIRKIAERIEYSPAAIYSYFPSKDDIFFALAEEGFRMLAASGSLASPGADPIENVRRAFWDFYTFSKEHPEYYALMFVDRSVPRIKRDWERFAFVHEIEGKVAGYVQRAVETGALPRSLNPATAVALLVASVHGAAAMRLCDRMHPGDSGDALARDTIEVTLAGLRAGVPLTFVPQRCCEPDDQSNR
jgi:AcrR family transcriptional regulator